MQGLSSYQIDVVGSEIEGGYTFMLQGNTIYVRSQRLDAHIPGAVWTGESITTPKTEYDRGCSDYPGSCSPWVENPRPQLVSAGAVIHPEWPLIALELTSNLMLGPVETGNRSGLVTVVGNFDTAAATAETIRRYADPDAASKIVAHIETPEFPELAAIEARLFRDSSGVQRITMILPETSTSAQQTIVFDYSRFNEVTITPPTDFITYTTPTPSP
jgi:hypothetical protein